MLIRGLLIWALGMILIYTVLYVRGLRKPQRRKVIRRTTTFVVASVVAFLFAVIIGLLNNIQGL